LNTTVNIMRRQVEREIGDTQGEDWFFRIPTPKRAHAGDQFTHGKWLRQIIIGPELQPTHAIVDSAACGQQQYTTGEMLGTQPTQQLETVHSRQTNIEHEEIEGFLAHFVQSGLATVNHFRIVTVLGQRSGDLPGHWNFIFNN
jgi:hypothetical protein